MKPSIEQMERIRSGWTKGIAPLVLAKLLRLSPTTVIAEYVRLDDTSK